MKTIFQELDPKTDFEKRMGTAIDPITQSIIGNSEEAKKTYLDYLIFSQS